MSNDQYIYLRIEKQCQIVSFESLGAMALPVFGWQQLENVITPNLQPSSRLKEFFCNLKLKSDEKLWYSDPVCASFV